MSIRVRIHWGTGQVSVGGRTFPVTALYLEHALAVTRHTVPPDADWCRHSQARPRPNSNGQIVMVKLCRLVPPPPGTHEPARAEYFTNRWSNDNGSPTGAAAPGRVPGKGWILVHCL